MKSIEWIATIETERGQQRLGVREDNNGMFELVDKYGDGITESFNSIYNIKTMAIESIKTIWGDEPTFKELTN